MKLNIEMSRKILRLLYEALFTVLIIYFIEIILVKEKPAPILIAIVLSSYVISYIIRERAANYGLILLLHLVMAGIIFVLPVSRGLAGIMLAVAAYQVLESFAYAGRNSALRPLGDIPWPTFLISFIIYLYGAYIKSDEIVYATYIIPVLLLFIYLLMVYVEGIRVYIDSTRDISGVPLKNIISTNTMIVTGILVLFMMGLILGNILHLENALHKLGEGILSIFRLLSYIIMFVVTIFGRMLSQGGEEDEEPLEFDSGQTVEHIGRIGSSVEIILKLGLLFLVIYIVYRITARIIKHLLVSRKFADDIIEVAETNRKSSVEDVGRKGIFGLVLSKEERARKYYRLRIMRYRYDISLDKSRTCNELEDLIRENKLDDVSEITGLYSDIRYGNRTVDRELLRKMNRLSRQ